MPQPLWDGEMEKYEQKLKSCDYGSLEGKSNEANPQPSAWVTLADIIFYINSCTE
jgi:hypothetical protein